MLLSDLHAATITIARRSLLGTPLLQRDDHVIPGRSPLSPSARLRARYLSHSRYKCRRERSERPIFPYEPWRISCKMKRKLAKVQYSIYQVWIPTNQNEKLFSIAKLPHSKIGKNNNNFCGSTQSFQPKKQSSLV